MSHALPLLRSLALLLASLPWASARADYDAGMIARQRGDYAAAYRELKPEADAGAADAKDAIGEMLATGKGVPKDEKAAAEMFRDAAMGGSVSGMLAYGTVALRGVGVMPRDEAAGIQWLSRAANAGNAAAMLLLGDCYLNGTGTPRNILLAHQWLLKAAQNGSAGRDAAARGFALVANARRQ